MWTAGVKPFTEDTLPEWERQQKSEPYHTMAGVGFVFIYPDTISTAIVIRNGIVKAVLAFFILKVLLKSWFYKAFLMQP